MAGRGNSLTNYIKKGESEAVITVVLHNRGKDAYRPEKYGKTIAVRRTIKEKGSS